MTFDLATATTVQTLRALEERELTSVELLDAMIANIERVNPDVNAVVAQDLERAQTEAAAADDLRDWGEPVGLLHGLPMTIKDTYETIDLVTTAGAPELAEHVPDRDATVVRLLRRAGAIVWAKTNVPLYAGDHQTYNEVYGQTNNPWDLSRTAGGSSGGAAAAVACGFSTAEVGSDIGGSIRQPAANNGVFGLKTTHGLIGGRGHIPGAPGSMSVGDLGVFGPIGRSCGDLRILLDALTRSTTAFKGVPGASLPRFKDQPDIVNLRVGLWSDDQMSPVDASVKSMIESAATELESAGAMVDAEIRPEIASEDLHNTYMHLLNSAMSAGFTDEMVASLAEKSGGIWEHSQDHQVEFARGVTLPHRNWIHANEQRVRAQLAWDEVFESVDLVLAPVQPVPAFAHDTERSYGKRTLNVNGADVPYRNLLFWAGLATMPLLPSVVIPLGLSDDGLPVGVQAIGPMWSDHKLISMGEEIASVLGVRFAPPPLATA